MLEHVESLGGKRTVPVRLCRNGIADETVLIKFPPTLGIAPGITRFALLTEVVPQPVLRIFIIIGAQEHGIHIDISEVFPLCAQEGIREKRFDRVAGRSACANFSALAL